MNARIPEHIKWRNPVHDFWQLDDGETVLATVAKQRNMRWKWTVSRAFYCVSGENKTLEEAKASAENSLLKKHSEALHFEEVNYERS